MIDDRLGSIWCLHWLASGKSYQADQNLRTRPMEWSWKPSRKSCLVAQIGKSRDKGFAMPWKSKCNRWDVFALYCLHFSLLEQHLLLLQTQQLRLLFLCKCTDAGLFSIGRLSVISYPREEHLEIVGTAPPQQLPRTWLLELSMLSVVVVVAPLLPISGCVANESLSKITNMSRCISIKQLNITTLLASTS